MMLHLDKLPISLYMVSQIKEESDSLTNSMDVIFYEQLYQEEIHIVISKDIRRFRKIATVVKGLKDRREMESLTKEMKTIVGTGGTL